MQWNSSGLWKELMTRCSRPLVQNNNCRSNCAINECMENFTKLVIMCGCTPPFWPVTTPRNCITCGQDVVKRLTDSTYRIQLSSNPRKRLVVHFDHLKPCNSGVQTAAAENPSAPESTNPPPVDSSLTRAIQDPFPLVQDWK